MASKCPLSTRSPTPGPASTSKTGLLYCILNSYQPCGYTSCVFLNRNVTLLHYLITILEQKYPKVSLIHEDLHNVPEAAKVKYVTKSHYYTHLRVSVSPKRVYVIENM